MALCLRRMFACVLFMLVHSSCVAVSSGADGGAAQGGAPPVTWDVTDAGPAVITNDADRDGAPKGEDCDDNNPGARPGMVEVPSDGADNDCNGQVDEVVDCEASRDPSQAANFAKAINLCGDSVRASLPAGDVESRSIRSQFGTQWKPQQGSSMILLSTGKAVDRLEKPDYLAQFGHNFGGIHPHPLYTAPRCAAPDKQPDANDLSEFKVSLKAPLNAKSLSFQFNFFSVEYPEYVCTEFNDRFVVLLTSSALDAAQLPEGQCLEGSSPRTCNISYDAMGQPVTINNGFFDHCESGTVRGVTNTCNHSVDTLEGTGFGLIDGLWMSGSAAGGATGWLTTKAPVTPGEDITLRFLIFDEKDFIYDSAVLVDNFRWETGEIIAPVTIN